MKYTYILGKAPRQIEKVKSALKAGDITAIQFDNVETLIKETKGQSLEVYLCIIMDEFEFTLEEIKEIENKVKLVKIIYIFFDKNAVQNNINKLVKEEVYNLVHIEKDMNLEDIYRDIIDVSENIMKFSKVRDFVSEDIAGEFIASSGDKLENVMGVKVLSTQVIGLVNGVSKEVNEDVIDTLQTLSRELKILVIDIDFSLSKKFSLSLESGEYYANESVTSLLGEISRKKLLMDEDVLYSYLKNRKGYNNLYYMTAPLAYNNIGNLSDYLTLVDIAKRTFNIIVFNFNSDLRVNSYDKFLDKCTRTIFIERENIIDIKTTLRNNRYLKSSGLTIPNANVLIKGYKGEILKESLEGIVESVDKYTKVYTSKKSLLIGLGLYDFYKEKNSIFQRLFRRSR